MKQFLITVLLILIIVVGFVAFFSLGPVKYFLGAFINWGTGDISSNNYNHYAWSDTVGWIDFNPAGGNVKLYDNELTGYVWAENIGWISLNCSNDNSCVSGVDYKVINDGEGNLSGYAWSDTAGWINFAPTFNSTDYGVKVAQDGTFSGYAWGENTGWISFNCLNDNSCTAVDYKVVSDGQFYSQVATTITIQTQPSGEGCYRNMLSTQPQVLVQDQHGQDMPDGTIVTASLSGGTGSLTGTLTAATSNGLATFGNLGYSIPSQSFTISFGAGSYSTDSNAVGPLSSDCSDGALGFAQVHSADTQTQTQTQPQNNDQQAQGPGPQGPPQQSGPSNPPTSGGQQISDDVAVPILQSMINILREIIAKITGN